MAVKASKRIKYGDKPRKEKGLKWRPRYTNLLNTDSNHSFINRSEAM